MGSMGRAVLSFQRNEHGNRSEKAENSLSSEGSQGQG